MPTFLSIGECMVELSGADGGLWRASIAGDTLNTAWYARACLPADWQVDYLTTVGTDSFSDRAVAFMAENGIGTSKVKRHPTRCIGLYAISLKDGERSFSYWRDASAARTLADNDEALKTAMAAADVVYLSGITLAILPPEAQDRLIDELAACRARGAKTVLDPNYRARLWPDSETARRVITEAARNCTILLPSLDDEAALFGDVSPHAALERYSGLGVEIVICKAGAKGAIAMYGGRQVDPGEMESVAPVDTTGAGDSFNGACLAALLTGIR